MTPSQRDYLAMERTSGFYKIMQTTVWAFVGIAALIHLGPPGYSAPLITMVVAITAYGILAGGSALTDMENLGKDMEADTSGTYYGRGLRARNIGALKMASTLMLILVGVAEIFAIVT